MSEKSTTPDLVELTRRALGAFSDRDVDRSLSIFAHDAVWDNSLIGMDVIAGITAIRRFFDEWLASYEEFEQEVVEIRDLGSGIVFSVTRHKARPFGSAAHALVREVFAFVLVWVDGRVVRQTAYNDVNDARAAAERLAESRG